MTTTARVGAAQIHFLVISAMAIAADGTREFKSLAPATVNRDEMIMDWLKVTAVPLGVLLMGACLWGCIKNSVWWRAFSELIAYDPRGLSIAPEADAIKLAAGLPNSSSQHESDLHLTEASHRGMGEDPAISTRTGDMMQQPTLQSANMITSSSVDVAPQL